MFKSIRTKSVVLFTLAAVASELAVGLIGIFSTVRSFHSDFEKAVYSTFTDDLKQQLTAAANAVSIPDQQSGGTGVIINETGPDNIENLRDIVASYSDALGLRTSAEFCILDRNGAVVYSSRGSSAVEASEVTADALAGTEAFSNPLTAEFSDYALPLMSGDSVRYIIYIKDTMSVQHAVTDRLWNDLLLSVILTGAAALILSIFISSSVLAPVKTLSAQIRKLAEGERTALSAAERNDELGELAGALIYLTASIRKKNDKKLTEQTKIETILQNMSDGIMVFDSKGKLTLINLEAKKLLNRKYVDDITFNRFFKEINADITLEELQYAPPEESAEREIKINDLMLQFSFAPVSKENKEGDIIVIVHDVTKHERLERARRDFVADVSHELRTPLTVIKSYADILADTPDAEPEVRTRFLDTISSETDRMTKIISDLLTLSKLDENANYTRPDDDIDIRSMLEGLAERLELTARKKNQTITYTPINDVPHIIGDRDGLERVFTNIISNALKYTPTGGEINIFSSKVYNDIIVKVSDNGIGIPKDQLPNIFDRFYRVDKARSRDKGGTGLGLAIAKQTIESAFHGKISIASELNKGTDVTVTIPAPKR